MDLENTIDKRKAIDPEKFGYMSLHYVVKLNENRLTLPEYKNYKDKKIEIQIRTILQHTWAEIEHDLGYKSQVEIPREIRRSFSSLAGLLEIADREFIGIRDDLAFYSRKLDSQIEQSLENIQIDNISLSKYLDQSNYVKETNLYIAKICDAKIVEEKDLSYYVKYLNNLDIFTLKKLHIELEKNIGLIKKIASSFLKENDDSFLYNTIILFYLGFAKIAQTQSINQITEFFRDNSIGLSDEVDNFAMELKDIYSEYTNENTNENKNG